MGEIEQNRSEFWGHNCTAGESVNPQSATIHRAMLRGICSSCPSGIFLNNPCRRSRSQFTRAQPIKNSFTGEWFYNPSSIADKQQVPVRRGNRRARQRRNCSPLLACRKRESFDRPFLQFANRLGPPYQTEVELFFTYRRLTRIAAR